jgi:hypothetical protein
MRGTGGTLAQASWRNIWPLRNGGAGMYIYLGNHVINLSHLRLRDIDTYI